MEFWPLKSPCKNSRVHRDSISQGELPWECEGSLPHTFLHSWASFLARNLVNPCFGRKPKARVATDEVYYKKQHMNTNMQLVGKLHDVN